MSGQAVRRAFDVARAGTLEGLGVRAGWAEGRVFPVPVVRGRRALSVRAALEWAFGAECARLDLDDDTGGRVVGRDDDTGGRVMGRDCIARLIERKALGCAVDGGGRSGSHPDADAIAAVVAGLPAALGGRGMAVRVAALARAGLQPDPMVGAKVACVPVAWRGANQNGRDAATECVGYDEYRRPGQRRVTFARVVCPVTYSPTEGQIAAARRDWMHWRAALRWIRGELQRSGLLDSLVVTDALPPLAPWEV